MGQGPVRRTLPLQGDGEDVLKMKFVVVGESGVGKSSIVDQLISKCPESPEITIGVLTRIYSYREDGQYGRSVPVHDKSLIHVVNNGGNLLWFLPRIWGDVGLQTIRLGER